MGAYSTVLYDTKDLFRRSTTPKEVFARFITYHFDLFTQLFRSNYLALFLYLIKGTVDYSPAVGLCIIAIV